MDKFNGGAEEQNLAFMALQRDLEECQRERDHQKNRADELEKEVDALKAEDQLNKKQQDALKDELEELKKHFSERELKHKTEVVCRLRDQKECIQALQKDFAESLREKDLQDRRLRDKNEAYDALQSFFEFSLKERDYLTLRINEQEKGKSLLEEEVDVLKVEASTKDQLNKKQINALKAKLKKQTTFFSELSSLLSPEVVCRPKDLKKALQALQRDLAESLREKDLEKFRADELAEKMSSQEKEVDALKDQASITDKQYKKELDALKGELEKQTTFFSELSSLLSPEVVCRPEDLKEALQALQRDLAESLREKDLEKFRADELAEKMSSQEKEVDALKDQASITDEQYKKELDTLKAKMKKQTTFFSELSSLLSPEVVCRPEDLKEALQALQRDLAESLREKDLEKFRADELAEKMSSQEKEVDALKDQASIMDEQYKKELDTLKAKMKKQTTFFSELSSLLSPEVVCRPEDLKEALQALQRDLAESLREKDLEKFRADELAEKMSSREKEVDALKDQASITDKQYKKELDALKGELKKQTTFFSELSSLLSPEVVCRPEDLKEALQALQRDLVESLREKDLEKFRADELAEKMSSREKEVDALKDQASIMDEQYQMELDTLKAKMKKQTTFFSELSSLLSPEVVCRPKDLKKALQALQRDLAESLREKDLEKFRADELAEKMSSREKEVDALKDQASIMDEQYKMELDTLKGELMKKNICCSELSSQLRAQGENNITLQRKLDELHIERERHMKTVDDLRKDIEEAKELFIEAENISVVRRAKKYFTPNSRRQFKLQMKIDKLGQE